MSAEAYVNGLLRDACANVVARLSDVRPAIPEPPGVDDDASDEMDAPQDAQSVMTWQHERLKTDADDSCSSMCEAAHDMATAFVDAMTSEALHHFSLGEPPASNPEPLDDTEPVDEEPLEDPEPLEDTEPNEDAATLEAMHTPSDESPDADNGVSIDEPCVEIAVEPPPTTPTDMNHDIPANNSKPSTPENGGTSAMDNSVVRAPSPVQVVSSPTKAPKSLHKSGRPHPMAPPTIKPAPTRTKRPMPPSMALKQLTPPPSFASLDIYPQVLTDVALFPASPRNDNQPDAFAFTTPPSMAKGSPKKLDPIVFRGGKYKAYCGSGRSDASPRARRLKADAPSAIVTTTVQRQQVSSGHHHHQVSGFCRQCLLYGDMRKLAECSEHNYFPPKSIA